MKNEIGRELKVSELVPKTVVVLLMAHHPMATTWWVLEVMPLFVLFTSGGLRTDLAAQRTGPDREQLTDNTGKRLHVYECLGEV